MSLHAGDAAPLVEGVVPGEPVRDDTSDLPVSLWDAHRALILDKLNEKLREDPAFDGYHLVFEEESICGSRPSNTGDRRAAADSEAGRLQ